MRLNGRPVDTGSTPALVTFFVIHYGMFWLVHGIFVLTLPLFGMMAGDGADDLVAGVSPVTILVALVALTISHGVSFYINFLRAGEYRRVSAAGQMFAPYGRLVVLHVTIILGGMAIAVTGAPEAAVAILVILKTVLDVGFHLAEHRRILAPRSGPSPAPDDAYASAFEGSSSTPCVWRARQAASRAPSSGVAEREDLGRQQPGVDGVADGHGRDRDAPRHLDDREQRVHPAEMLGRDGHADDRDEGLGREHARQVGRAARAGDDDPQATLRSRLRVAEQLVRRAVRRDDPQLGRDVQLHQHGTGRFEDREVRAAAADHADDRWSVTLDHRSPPSSDAVQRNASRAARARRRGAGIRGGGGQMPHLASLEDPPLVVQVEVDGRILHGPPDRPRIEPGVAQRALAPQVDHRRRREGIRRPELEPADRPDVLLELRGRGTVQRPVAAVVDTGRAR